MLYVIYDTETGRVGLTGESELQLAPPLFEGQAIAWTTEPAPAYSTWDAETGTAAPLPDFPAVASKLSIVADGADTAEITGLPVPCEVVIDGRCIEVDDGSLVLRSRHPAVFRVSTAHPAYLPWSVEIEAH